MVEEKRKRLCGGIVFPSPQHRRKPQKGMRSHFWVLLLETRVPRATAQFQMNFDSFVACLCNDNNPIHCESLPNFRCSGSIPAFETHHFMSKICVITGKTPLTARNVSHSNVKTKRRQMPNLQKKTLVNPATGKPITVMVSGRGLRTLNKWAAEGLKVDLRNFIG